MLAWIGYAVLQSTKTKQDRLFVISRLSDDTQPSDLLDFFPRIFSGEGLCAAVSQHFKLHHASQAVVGRRET